jgi:3-oxoacyl-[acyl-carrier protein] reductase
MEKPMFLKNKTAFITGTNRGIGKACLELFASAGVDVVAHSRRETPEFLKMTAEVSEKYRVKIMPVFFDMVDNSAMTMAVQNLILKKTPIQILVNCAGVISGGLFQMTSVEKVKEVFDINLFAPMRLTQLLLKIMRRQSSGIIVNVGSTGGLDPGIGNTAYAASKSALMTWTKTLAAELGAFGIRANAVAPFLTKTDMAKSVSEIEQQKMIDHISLKRPAEPIEIAKVILFLASDASSFINGQILRADGGVVL